MRAALPLLLVLAACDGADFSVEDALLAEAIAGEEETLARGGLEEMTGDAPPPLFRECDANGTFFDRLAEADQDGDGLFDPPPRMEDGPPPPWMPLLFVYDRDKSRSLDEAERAVLLDDFTARCEALHARVLADFDADGSGELDATEQAAARAAHEARHAELGPPGGPPPRGQGDTGSRPPPPEPGEIPPPFRVFDVDGSGDLDEAEEQAMFEAVTAHVRAGDPPFPPPPRPEQGG